VFLKVAFLPLFQRVSLLRRSRGSAGDPSRSARRFVTHRTKGLGEVLGHFGKMLFPTNCIIPATEVWRAAAAATKKSDPFHCLRCEDSEQTVGLLAIEQLIKNFYEHVFLS
jgi:hypothetical protein